MTFSPHKSCKLSATPLNYIHSTMGIAMNKDLIPFYEPPEFSPDEHEVDLDAFIPANDTLAITKRNILRQVRAATIQMKPRFVSAITSVIMSGDSFASAARRYRIGAQALSRHLKVNKPAIELVQALHRLKSLEEGTNYLQREAMLWRMATNNEHTDPRASISAIAEINRTKADTPDHIQKQKINEDITNQPQIIIQLQDARLTASPLDELPPSMQQQHQQQKIKDIN